MKNLFSLFAIGIAMIAVTGCSEYAPTFLTAEGTYGYQMDLQAAAAQPDACIASETAACEAIAGGGGDPTECYDALEASIELCVGMAMQAAMTLEEVVIVPGSASNIIMYTVDGSTPYFWDLTNEDHPNWALATQGIGSIPYVASAEGDLTVFADVGMVYFMQMGVWGGCMTDFDADTAAVGCMTLCGDMVIDPGTGAPVMDPATGYPVIDPGCGTNPVLADPTDPTSVIGTDECGLPTTCGTPVLADPTDPMSVIGTDVCGYILDPTDPNSLSDVCQADYVAAIDGNPLTVPVYGAEGAPDPAACMADYGICMGTYGACMTAYGDCMGAYGACMGAFGACMGNIETCVGDAMAVECGPMPSTTYTVRAMEFGLNASGGWVDATYTIDPTLWAGDYTAATEAGVGALPAVFSPQPTGGGFEAIEGNLIVTATAAPATTVAGMLMPVDIAVLGDLVITGNAGFASAEILALITAEDPAVPPMPLTMAISGNIVAVGNAGDPAPPAP